MIIIDFYSKVVFEKILFVFPDFFAGSFGGITTETPLVTEPISTPSKHCL